jgi:hypothetical protein
LQQTQKNICVSQYRHLHSASAVNRIAADSFIGEQRHLPRMALYPGVKFTGPLFSVRRFLRCLALMKPPPNGFYSYVQHVIWIAYQASLDGLSD